MSAPLITVAPSGEMTLIGFYTSLAATLEPNERLVLNHLMRGLSERGWLPSLSDLVTGLEARGESVEAAHAAIDSLITKRLLTLDASQTRIDIILGTISASRTPHRAHLEGGVNVFTFGGFELFCLNSLFVRPVDCTSFCAQCNAALSFRMEDGAVVELAPNGAAAFLANWDGESALKALCERSPLFCSNACLSAWSEAHPEEDGLPISSDLLLHVGVMFASESGAARFSMYGQNG